MKLALGLDNLNSLQNKNKIRIENQKQSVKNIENKLRPCLSIIIKEICKHLQKKI